jgi:exodeoxyribonuclease V beta subunit
VNREILDIGNMPLSGCQLIEASAGTGKTYSIIRIYIRLLLERRLDVREVLVMTFTRTATEELRSRIAEELRNARDNWATLVEADEFYQAVAARLSGEEARLLLHRGLLHLDEAPVFTIHGFCRQVLTRHAFATGVDFNTSMEQELDELKLQAVRDWYRRLAEDEEAYRCVAQTWLDPEAFVSAFTHVLGRSLNLQTADPQQLMEQWLSMKASCHAQLQQFQAGLFECLVDGHKNEAMRIREWESLMQWLQVEDISPMPARAAAFLDGRRWSRLSGKTEINGWLETAKQLKAESPKLEDRLYRARAYQWAKQGIGDINQRILQAKSMQRVMGFDDLVVLLAEALQGDSGQLLAATLAKEYPAALVDEFQDTDPQQYQILQHIYTPGEDSDTALYLIGDPKQAIYAFRGGDVFAYLQARADTDRQWYMDTNWRSSPAMIQAYNRLFHGAAPDQPEAGIFGPGIDYPLIRSADQKKGLDLADGVATQALQLVHFPVHEDYANKKGMHNATFRAEIARWCAAEITRLLSGEVLLQDRAVQAKDIVILVRDRSEADNIRLALEEAGLSSVYLSLRDRLFDSEQAAELCQVMRGILDLEEPRLAKSALLSAYLGGSPRKLQRLKEDEDFWEEQHQILLKLRRQWLEQGFVAMALAMFHQYYLPPEEGRERALTNSLHLMEILQQATQRHTRPRELLSWFEDRISGAGETVEAELRLETDEELLRIQTQHGAKGLEYPVVFIPFATRYKDPLKFSNRRIDILNFHDSEDYSAISYLGWDADAARQCRLEGHAETVRLMYVAVTRAIARCYICSTAFSGYELSPLGQILGIQTSDSLQTCLEDLAADSAGIGLSVISDLSISPSPTVSTAVSDPDLTAAIFTGRLQQGWWLSSFSALTRNLRHGGLSLPDRDQEDQRQQQPVATELRFALPPGANAGNLLHEIFENLDFSAPDWEAACQRPLARFGVLPGEYQISDLVNWLNTVLETELFDGMTLGKLPWQQTLRESGFYFPMSDVIVKELEQLLAEHRQQNSTVALSVKPQLQGMMHGYIDLIFEWGGKYYLADYKSNYLGASLQEYGPDNMRKSMEASMYDLQYLLYSLALHRYLGENLSDYRPDIHFGGVYYLYLRGMKKGMDSGVYHKSIAADTLEELDNIFGKSRYV